jgi:hypothetical protein
MSAIAWVIRARRRAASSSLRGMGLSPLRRPETWHWLAWPEVIPARQESALDLSDPHGGFQIVRKVDRRVWQR